MGKWLWWYGFEERVLWRWVIELRYDPGGEFGVRDCLGEQMGWVCGSILDVAGIGSNASFLLILIAGFWHDLWQGERDPHKGEVSCVIPYHAK